MCVNDNREVYGKTVLMHMLACDLADGHCNEHSLLMCYFVRKKNSEYDQEIPQLQTADKTHGTARKSHSTITRHQEDNQLSLPHQDDCKIRMAIK